MEASGTILIFTVIFFQLVLVVFRACFHRQPSVSSVLEPLCKSSPVLPAFLGHVDHPDDEAHREEGKEEYGGVVLFSNCTCKCHCLAEFPDNLLTIQDRLLPDEEVADDEKHNEPQQSHEY